MKKGIYTSIVVILALSSCSKEACPSKNSNPFSFQYFPESLMIQTRQHFACNTDRVYYIQQKDETLIMSCYLEAQSSIDTGKIKDEIDITALNFGVNVLANAVKNNECPKYGKISFEILFFKDGIKISRKKFEYPIWTLI